MFWSNLKLLYKRLFYGVGLFLIFGKLYIFVKKENEYYDKVDHKLKLLLGIINKLNLIFFKISTLLRYFFIIKMLVTTYFGRI